MGLGVFLFFFSFFSGGCSLILTKNKSNLTPPFHEERVVPFDSSNFTIQEEKQLATSKILTTPLTANFMAVYWLRPLHLDYDYNFLIRSSADGRHWSRWKDVFLMAEGADHEMEPYDYSQLIYTKGAKFFQFKIARVDSPARHFNEFHFVFIDSRQLPVVQKNGGAANLKKPAYVSREQWGSADQLSWSDEKPLPLQRVSHLFLHHSALDNTLSHDVCDDAVRAYQLYHIKTKKWGDIGYHHLICQHGVLFEGRRGPGSFAYKEVVGVHAKGFNTHSLGVCVIGSYIDSSLINQTEKISFVREMIEKGEFRDEDDFSNAGSVPSKEAQNMIIDFLIWKARQHRISLPNILGYQDVTTTLSPGPHLYKLIPSLRAAVAEKMKN